MSTQVQAGEGNPTATVRFHASRSCPFFSKFAVICHKKQFLHVKHLLM